MSETRTVNVLGTKSAKAELPAELFDVQTNVPLIHQVVVAQQAAARQGTHATKTRGDVCRRWRQAVAPEGHRPRPPGFAPRSRSGPAVASCTARSRAATPSARPRR